MLVARHYDVVIIGAGLAGLSLARQLLMNSGKSVLHLEKRDKVPIARQKVGESNVQVSGYYFGKVLDMEEYLFHEHLMKYNLRFLWKTPATAGNDFEDYDQSYIRTFSNIPCYQLNRNKFESELLDRNRTCANYQLLEGVGDLEVVLGDGEPHRLSFSHESHSYGLTAEWVVDTSGRSRQLARKMGLGKTSDIVHNATFFWVDGIVNIEKLTDAAPRDIRLRRARRSLGHSPMWLATNHFMGEGFWFWVIPLQGRTSFGLVYDTAKIDPRLVNNQEKMLKWLFAEFPLFERALADREIIDFSTLRHYSHDCSQTIHKNKWAMSGESGRFTDPLYSPGGDTIAIHNTLITDAIIHSESPDFAFKIGLYESMFKTVYWSFVPSFQVGYQALGDQEAFAMKYTWELSIYFAFYVFPFINDLYTEKLFLVPYFRRFSALGAINRTVQKYISAYFRWKQGRPTQQQEPTFFDFTAIETLPRTEKTFYKIGLEPDEAVSEIDNQLANLSELARYIIVHIDSVIREDPSLYKDRSYINEIDLENREFDEEAIRSAPTSSLRDRSPYPWSIDSSVLRRGFHPHQAATPGETQASASLSKTDTVAVG